MTALLQLVKIVEEGSATAADWTLYADGPTPLSGAGGVAITAVAPGLYRLYESPGPPGYESSVWDFEGASIYGDDWVQIREGDSIKATVRNTYFGLVESKYERVSGTTTLRIPAVGSLATEAKLGSLIVVGLSAGVNQTDNSWVISDSLGNVYEPFVNFAQNYGGMAFWTRSSVAGPLSVTCVGPTIDGVKQGIVGLYPPAAGVLDQPTFGIGQYTPADRKSGVLSSGVTLANSLVVSFLFVVYGIDLVSETGDTLQQADDNPGIEHFFLYDRLVQGPGNTYVKIKFNGQFDLTPQDFKLTVGVFSRPLPRPRDKDFGTAIFNTALRPGAGAGNGPDEDTQADINRPIRVSFPYRLRLNYANVLLAIGVPLRNLDTIVLTDDLGNVWDFLGRSPVLGSGQVAASHCVAFFKSKLNSISGPRDMFRIKIDVDSAGTGDVYQMTALGITEFPPGDVQYRIAGLRDLQDLTVPTRDRIRTDAIVDVVAGTYLHAMAFYGGSNTQDEVLWLALDDYDLPLEAQWTHIQEPDQLTNRRRMGTSALMNKIAPTDGDYDAQVDLRVISGNYGSGGGMALVAVSYDTEFHHVRVR